MGGKNRDQNLTQTSTATSEASIPGFLRPFLQQSTDVAGGALSGLQEGTQGQLVAGFNPDQLAAINQARALAGGEGGFLPTAQQTLLDTAQGNFLFGGQGFNEAVDAAVRQAQPNILSTFGAAGRGTGGLAQEAIAQSASDAFARLFNQERGRQLQSAIALPGIASSGIGLLSDIGALQQQQEQRELTAPLQAQQSLLASALGGLPTSSLIGQQSTQTQTQPLFQNRAAGGLGGALTGAQLGSTFGPIGTGLGAIGGGLLGAFL